MNTKEEEKIRFFVAKLSCAFVVDVGKFSYFSAEAKNSSQLKIDLTTIIRHKIGIMKQYFPTVIFVQTMLKLKVLEGTTAWFE
jgi:hypothetical protein